MKRILFVNRGGVGNCLMMTPAIRWVRWKHLDGAHIAAAVEPTSIRALDTNLDLDGVMEIEEAARQPWDVVYCPPPSPRGWDEYLARMAHEGARMAAAPDALCDKIHEARAALELVGWTPEAGHSVPLVSYRVTRGCQAVADAMVEANAPQRPRVAFAFGYVDYPKPGHSKRRKHWPLAYFARVAKALWRDGARIIWMGTREWEGAHLHRLRRPPSWAPMDVPFAVTAGILARCDLLVSADNALMHLGDALGISVVTMFGFSPKCKVTPWNGNATVLSLDLPCQPCYRTNAKALPCDSCCWCMRGLTPDVVIAAARERLEASCPASPS